jgi:4-hydroxyproline epimerase
MSATVEIQVVDSHTGGEPTRVIVAGMPSLKGETVAEKLNDFRKNHDEIRRGVVCEPRGSDVVVGALLTESMEMDCVAGVIFFNNVGFLGMCGHGTIGVVETLRDIGKIQIGKAKIETPVGVIEIELFENGDVSLRNVPAFRFRDSVPVNVPGVGVFVGDIAWGGNWFYLVTSAPPTLPKLNIENTAELVRIASLLKDSLYDFGVFGAQNAVIDHVEFFGESSHGANSKNFVLCPGKVYDRSPCGTGTSAKLACLYASKKLQPGEKWIQESITGSTFEGWIEVADDEITPNIRGRAYLTSKSTLLFHRDDPFCWGIL